MTAKLTILTFYSSICLWGRHWFPVASVSNHSDMAICFRRCAIFGHLAILCFPHFSDVVGVLVNIKRAETKCAKTSWVPSRRLSNYSWGCWACHQLYMSTYFISSTIQLIPVRLRFGKTFGNRNGRWDLLDGVLIMWKTREAHFVEGLILKGNKPKRELF